MVSKNFITLLPSKSSIQAGIDQFSRVESLNLYRIWILNSLVLSFQDYWLSQQYDIFLNVLTILKTPGPNPQQNMQGIMKQIKCQAEMSQCALGFISTMQWSHKSCLSWNLSPTKITGPVLGSVFFLNSKWLSCYYWTKTTRLPLSQQCPF